MDGWMTRVWLTVSLTLRMSYGTIRNIEDQIFTLHIYRFNIPFQHKSNA